MSRISALPVVVGVFVAISSAAGAQVLTEHDVSQHMAMTIADEVIAECGSHVSVAVIDRAGRLRLFLQGDGAQPHNLELARRKAYTAQTFGRTSLEWATRTATTNQGQRMLADVIPQQGGVPIKFGAETIGGVGVSGAANGGAQEEACAKGGVAKVADQLK